MTYNEQLTEILQSIGVTHQDDDTRVCASNYANCSLCGERVYCASRIYHNRKHTATPKYSDNPCDCWVATQTKEALAAIAALNAATIGEDVVVYLVWTEATEAKIDIGDEGRRSMKADFTATEIRNTFRADLRQRFGVEG